MKVILVYDIYSDGMSVRVLECRLQRMDKSFKPLVVDIAEGLLYKNNNCISLLS